MPLDDIMSHSPTWPLVKAKVRHEQTALGCACHIRRHPQDPHLDEVKVCKARALGWVVVLSYFTAATYQ